MNGERECRRAREREQEGDAGIRGERFFFQHTLCRAGGREGGLVMGGSAEQEVESEGWMDGWMEVGCAGDQSSGRHRESPGNPLDWLASDGQAMRSSR